MTRPLRIGHQLSGRVDGSPVDTARRAEELGFDIVLAADHVGSEMSPLPTLAAIASATTTIRLGTLVLNNDMRNPVQLAWDVASIDVLSGGRFELGLGAGHTPQEYTATGIERSDAVVRKQRLAESVEIIRALLDGRTVDHHGEHYRLEHARTLSASQERLPILIGGNGANLLGHAGAHADIIGLQGVARTLDDGHSHSVDWRAEHLDAQLAQVRDGASERFGDLEFNALVQVVQITDDREAALARVCERVDGLTMDDARATPYLLVGAVDEIVLHMLTCNERWGINYFAVRELDEFAPILKALRR
ncbi:MAG TPA: TIGR03621 family F420-dependent LLM class oxidoreductase [Ilumatobacteraceae bacterium]|nr:TIGR03621 family F420-dependent LLM class oxidoreductase [Ilumatobacteraceae bacterium]